MATSIFKPNPSLGGCRGPLTRVFEVGLSNLFLTVLCGFVYLSSFQTPTFIEEFSPPHCLYSPVVSSLMFFQKLNLT